MIFDLYENFDFFKENPKGIESGTQKSLNEIVFALKLQVALYLKEKIFKNDIELQSYSDKLLSELHQSVAELNRDRFDVKMKLETVMNYNSREIWNNLDKGDVKKIQDILAPLIRPAQFDTDLARFYDKMIYALMLKRVETPDTEEFISRLRIPITKVATISKKLLKKTSIPEIKNNEDIIKITLQEDFWKNEGLKHLEKIRQNIRELVKFIDPVDQKYVTTNFEDAILEHEIVETSFSDARAHYETTFTNNLHRLEELVRENKNNVTIKRIQNGDVITEDELKSLEKILFQIK